MTDKRAGIQEACGQATAGAKAFGYARPSCYNERAWRRRKAAASAGATGRATDSVRRGGSVKVIKIAEVPKEDSTDSPIFFGGAVSRQDLVTEKTSGFFNFSVVNFAAGAKNKFHTHTSDQILLVTHGTGIVANQEGERVVTEGAVIHVPAGEKHWHGATEDSAFSHITLTAAGSSTVIAE